MTHELLAQLVEVASVAATVSTRLKKPVDVPRPDAKARRASPAAVGQPGNVISMSDAAMKRGIAVLRSTARPRQ